MRLIHCADLHLDSRMTTNLSKEQARERKKELLRTFEEMVDYAAAHEVEAILIAGDLFDTKNISATARHTVWDAIRGHEDITFFYLKGNHDTDSFLKGQEELPKNFKTFHDTWTAYDLGEVVISGLELSRENVLGAASSLVLDSSRVNLVMLHGQVVFGGRRPVGETIVLREFKHKGIDYLALGHVHAFQEGELDGRGVWCYPGCLEGRGFDECGDHGFVLLEVGDRQVSREFVPFARRRLYCIEAQVTDCARPAELVEAIGQALDREAPRKTDLIKVVLTGERDVESEIDLDYLCKRLEPDYYFIKIEDETRLRVDMERYRLDVSLKGEFVRTVMAAEDLGDEDRAAIIQYGLRAIAGEEVLGCD